jgi:hypothetical protein
LQRQIKRTKPEALVGRAETLAGAELEARARRAPVQTELTELLFQRSALGQRRKAEAERAQAGITAIGEEMDIRKAMAQLDQPAPLSPGIQTELFKRAFPAPEKDVKGVIVTADGRKRLVDPTTGKLIADLGTAKVGTGVKKVTAAARKQLIKLRGVESSAKQIEGMIKKIQDTRTFGEGIAARTGGYLSQWAGWAGMAEDVSTYDQFREAMIAPLARAVSGEVGVLTDKDVARAEGLLPSTTDTDNEIKIKLKNLNDAINNSREAVLEAEEGIFVGELGAEEGEMVVLRHPTTGVVREFDDLSSSDMEDALSQGYQVVEQ